MTVQPSEQASPANFDSVVFDGLMSHWMEALSSDSVEALVLLGPDMVQPMTGQRSVRVVHPPRFLSMARALAESQDFSEPHEPNAPLVLWQDITRGTYAQLERWRLLALSYGQQSLVRLVFPLPRERHFECYLLTPRALHDKNEVMNIAWSVLNMWPRIKSAMADVLCPLSVREKECLALAFDGLTAAQTGKRLDCSERTVNYYLANAMRKLNVGNKLAAVERAIWYGVI